MTSGELAGSCWLTQKTLLLYQATEGQEAALSSNGLVLQGGDPKSLLEYQMIPGQPEQN